jgi:exopolyphosphatase/guanosine-5'-triphosphate,3'-diphosphate pyrophosphatase
MAHKTMNLRKAIIDLGTNTFDLIIVELHANTHRFTVVHTDKSFVSLGKGGINERRITVEAINRAKFALEHFIQACNEYKLDIENIHAFGTSALRDATNADEFRRAVKRALNLEISIIDGKQEAQYIYEGIKGIHRFTESSCIMDIGGGSTEFIFADQHEVMQIDSVDIGVSRILQRFNVPDQLDQNSVDEIENFLAQKAGNLFGRRKATTLIGAAGSFETFYQLVTEQVSYDNFATHEIPMSKLNETLEHLINSSLTERERSYWIPDYRRKMIHIAALQTRWVIQHQKIASCYFSPAALKEGVLFSSYQR